MFKQLLVTSLFVLVFAVVGFAQPANDNCADARDDERPAAGFQQGAGGGDGASVGRLRSRGNGRRAPKLPRTHFSVRILANIDAQCSFGLGVNPNSFSYLFV